MSTTTHTLSLFLSPTDAASSAQHVQLLPETSRLGGLFVGPDAFARRLGTLLGVSVQSRSEGERIAAVHLLLEGMDDGNTWFSATRLADPIGAAKWMLQARDQLREAGWSGVSTDVTSRLSALADLDAAISTTPGTWGLVDQMIRLQKAVLERTLSLQVRVVLTQPRAQYSAQVDRILTAMDTQSDNGFVVQAAALPTAGAPEDTDLGRLQRALLGQSFSPPVGDGSVVFMQSPRPWEAAVAAVHQIDDNALWLVTEEGPLLDQARAKFDFPRFGARQKSLYRPALQVLPLALSLQSGPQDPQDALALLTLPICPVAGPLRHALIGALSNRPGIGGELWAAAVKDGLAKIEDADRKVSADDWVTRLFPKSPPSLAPAGELADLCRSIARWLARRGAKLDGESDLVCQAAAGVATTLARILGQMPEDHCLDAITVRQLFDLASGSGAENPVSAEAGAPPMLTHPAAVPQGVSHVVWFGLNAGAAEQSTPIYWTEKEREALIHAGAVLPEGSIFREVEQSQWIHPILSATERFTAVRWIGQSEEVANHPFMDLLKHCCDFVSLWTLPLGEVLKSNKSVAPVPGRVGIAPVSHWSVKAGVVPERENWSASSMESLVKCPLAWTLNYAAGLKAGSVEALPDVRTLSGSFGHALFEEVLFHKEWVGLTPDAASAALGAAFEARVSEEAAPLNLAINAAIRVKLKDDLQHAIANLVRILKAGAWVPEAAEADLGSQKGTYRGHQLNGSIDLLVKKADGSRAVIDLKLGWRSGRQDQLLKGTSIQLAVYAHAVSPTDGNVSAAYFILEDGVMLTTDANAFPGAAVVVGANADSPKSTWVNVKAAADWHFQVLQEGHVWGRGKHLDHKGLAASVATTVGDPPDDPWSKTNASCKYCDHQRLCNLNVEGRQ